MPARAALVVGLFAVSGIGAAFMAVANWESQDMIKFASFLLVAMFFSGMRFRVPGVMGTISPAIIFVLLSVLELSVPETIALGVAAMIVQCYWQETTIPPVAQVAFTVCSMAAAAAAAAVVYHAVAPAVDPMIGLVLATLVLFIVNTAPVTVALAVAEQVSILQTWKECYLRLLPYYFGSAAVAALVNFAGRYVGWQTVLLSGPAVYLVFRSYRLHLARLENETKHVEDVSSLHLRTIEALAMAIEAKDSTTHEHLARVQVYAYELGRDLGLKAQEMEALQAASILHDIGKLAVPEHIISKPGKLTPEEFEKMKIHPVVGAEILERVQFPYPVVPIVRAHHEKWDGTGYPAGLRGEDIPIGARILAAVDCLDALATDRQYRRALPLPEAMKVVEKESGKAFDPRVVELLSKRYVELEKMAKAKNMGDAGKLSTDVKVERGDAPAAGFEQTAEKGAPEDFVQQIAAARQEVQSLFEISRELSGSLSMSDTLSMLSVKLRNVVPHNTMVVWLRNEDKLIPEFVTGDEYRLYGALQIPIGQGLSGWVLENSKAIVNGNPSVESGYLGDQAKPTALRSAVALPLEGINGINGVLSLYSSERDHFSKDHLRLLMAVSGKIALAVENAKRVQALEASATTDALTGLSNARSLFIQLDAELARAKRDQLPVTVMTFDLDDFKQINARFGHLEGDRALRAIAQQMRSACREYDTLARMGGDEFVLVMAGARLEDLEQRKQLFRGLISGVSRQLFSGELLPVSIGTAQFPEDGTDAEQLLAEADRQLYKEKRQRAQAGVRKPLVTRQAEWTGASLVH
ncbi:MAG: HD domain-containing phosphohydrolase [Bryobacteraceae bacterium]